MKQHSWQIAIKAYVGDKEEIFQKCRNCGKILDDQNPFFNMACTSAPKTERELIIERLEKETK